ncbi:MAG TPA: type ISP restriction/modification enzyme [Sandaracinaceae bacterium LLY-WYZ-13_1]|nr:type ISP restriction/modification enzyme [Sandaracinaceae bacterium LLY-WYZ-13_1]
MRDDHASTEGPDRHRAVARAVERAGSRRDAATSDARRRERGIVHTPGPVARYVARRADRALAALGRAGLADPDVAVVDLACGPGVFLAAAMAEATGSGPRAALGLELDPAVAAAAEETLAPAARAVGWPLRVVATDTLAGPVPLTEAERRGASLAILGNPPWAGRSANRGAAHTDALLADFRREADGRPLSERKVGVLSDDYVRFVRWACEEARAADGGAVLALVTNASFLDGPVHRGMRAALLRWFDRVEVLDLGGSALVARRGDADENVFGVRPAAAVTVAVRAPGAEPRAGTARHAALRGRRADKLAALADPGADPLEADAQELAPRPPLLRLAPSPAVAPAYEGWPSLPELVPFHREGLQTNRDAFCVDADRARLEARLEGFAAGRPGPWPGKADVASRHYDPEAAREAVRAALARGEGPRRVAYRPLDDRWVAALPTICHRPRPALLAAMDRSELALLTVRKDRGERPWAHFGATRHAVDNCWASARSSCRTRAFPTHRPDGSPNLDADRVAAWAPGLGVPRPRDLLRYVLCVLAARSYRARYDAHLRADYPRIPPPVDEAFFRRAVRAGAALEAAFREPRPDGPSRLALTPLVIGHHGLRQARPGVPALRAAIERCDDVVRRVARNGH